MYCSRFSLVLYSSYTSWYVEEIVKFHLDGQVDYICGGIEVIKLLLGSSSELCTSGVCINATMSLRM